MQYVITAYDGTDPDAIDRRLDAREAHIRLCDELKAKGHILFGAALLDENDQMAGSVMIVDFDSQKDLEDWLDEEPYVTGNVWVDIEIAPCRVGPSFVVQ